jgi:uncharacterized protein (TIGR00255 family)
MKIASMTGFSRTMGASASYRWAWELKSVNAKGLDLRVRVPPGFDAVEAQARGRLGQQLTRGTCHATLQAQREAGNISVRVNKDVLGAVMAAIQDVVIPDSIRPASLDGLLALRGVVDIGDKGEDENELAHVHAEVLAGLDQALDALLSVRLSEGASLAQILSTRLDRIANLTQQAETNPGRRPEAIRARLAQTIATLGGTFNFDQDRLHQEALILAAKADVREEIDRLVTHVAAARDMMQKGGAVGRRLDFLAQELGREANTLCAKSNDVGLTAIGLELRVEIEQFREQIQNIE